MPAEVSGTVASTVPFAMKEIFPIGVVNAEVTVAVIVMACRGRAGFGLTVLRTVVVGGPVMISVTTLEVEFSKLKSPE